MTTTKSIAHPANWTVFIDTEARREQADNAASIKQVLADLLDQFRAAKPGDKTTAACGCSFITYVRLHDGISHKQVVYCPDHPPRG